MKNIALFAGSFCPFTKGHEDIVRKALPLFDHLYIALGHNPAKEDIFPVEQRLQWIRDLYDGETKVTVMAYEGLTTDLCRQLGANYLVRGVRNATDFAAEEELRRINLTLNPEVETIFIPSSPEWAIVSSSLVRELWSLHADYSAFLSYKLPEKSE